jgi:deazaflavin-dependent oxidoreductase (nitroreductase family)
VSGPSPRMRRVIGRAMRAPAVFDRRGFRWLLGAFSPAPIVVLVHRGRRSGRMYRTPVEAIAGDPEQGEVVVSPLWGERSDWYRNVLAGGLVEAHVRGDSRQLEWRQLSEEEKREAISAYRREHPLYSRAILRVLARVHGLAGDPAEAVTRALPMLGLRRTLSDR